MTIRKKLILSNILMILIPVIVAMVVGLIALGTYGHRYWDSLEEMFENENGVYSVQSLIYAYKEEMVNGDWEKYAGQEVDDTGQIDSGLRDIQKLEQEIQSQGYYFRIRIDNKEVYSSLRAQEEDIIQEYSADSHDDVSDLVMSNEKGSLIKNMLKSDGRTFEITAVQTAENGSYTTDNSYLKKYIISFAVIFFLFILLVVVVTNAVLSRWITRMIMKPLYVLKKGSKEIEQGNLDFELDYHKEDEFGEVCDEFSDMRERLKESVDTRLEYEQYRKELIVGISHDLRTPLTSIKGYVEGLQDGIANTDEKRKRYYEAIHIRALDMEALVDSLSTFARLENKQYKYQLEKVNVDEYLRQLIREYEEEAKSKNAVVLYDNNVPDREIMLDVQEMHRVFINLFENSIKYRTNQRSVIHIFVNERKPYLEIEVADDGPGVPSQELTHIFTSFYRGDESRTVPGNGSGLGLSIVRQIIEGHKGKIEAYNHRGLVMRIWLPLLDSATADRAGGENI